MAKQKHTCSRCQIPFPNSKLFREHVRTFSHGWPCPECPKPHFCDSFNLIQHIEAKHGPQRLYPCSLCLLAFTSQTALELHVSSHEQAPEGTGEGSVSTSSEAPASQDTLACIHVQILHGEDDGRHCRRCVLTFSIWAELSEHYKSSNAHPKCPVCGLTAYNTRLLHSHMRVHPTCQICSEHCCNIWEHLTACHANITNSNAAFTEGSRSFPYARAHIPDLLLETVVPLLYDELEIDQAEANVSPTSSPDEPFPKTVPTQAASCLSASDGESRPFSVRSFSSSPSLDYGNAPADNPIRDDWDAVSELSYVSDTGLVIVDSAPQAEMESITVPSVVPIIRTTSPLNFPHHNQRSSECIETQSSAGDNTYPGKRAKQHPSEAVCAESDSSLPTQSTASHTSKWCCRLCGKDPEQPTATVCGHIFCHGCIVEELSKNLQCPTCKRVVLVRLEV